MSSTSNYQCLDHPRDSSGAKSRAATGKLNGRNRPVRGSLVPFFNSQTCSAANISLQVRLSERCGDFRRFSDGESFFFSGNDFRLRTVCLFSIFADNRCGLVACRDTSDFASWDGDALISPRSCSNPPAELFAYVIRVTRQRFSSEFGQDYSPSEPTEPTEGPTDAPGLRIW